MKRFGSSLVEFVIRHFEAIRIVLDQRGSVLVCEIFTTRRIRQCLTAAPLASLRGASYRWSAKF